MPASSTTSQINADCKASQDCSLESDPEAMAQWHHVLMMHEDPVMQYMDHKLSASDSSNVVACHMPDGVFQRTEPHVGLWAGMSISRSCRGAGQWKVENHLNIKCYTGNTLYWKYQPSI